MSAYVAELDERYDTIKSLKLAHFKFCIYPKIWIVWFYLLGSNEIIPVFPVFLLTIIFAPTLNILLHS